MIQPETKLKVADNSGAKMIKCFRVLGGTRKRYARLGEIIVASVKEAEPRASVKKKEVVRAVIVRQKSPHRRADGTYIRFDENAAIILDGEEMKATRVSGPIAREIREKGFKKIISLAPEVL
ncbi:MAG: 50S ribosomal protein L14 [Patescibacteria group bacterium]|nr:50S ribosomal protein L14 [Patescibacteria group bacterium]